MLQNFGLGIEAGDLAQPLCVGIVGLAGNEPDELSFDHYSAMIPGQFAHNGANLRNRGAPKVGDVHAELCAAVDGHSQGLDARHASHGSTNCAGNGPGSGNRDVRRPGQMAAAGSRRLRCFQIKVVGDQELARTDGAGSSGRVEGRAANIRTAGHIFGGQLAQTLELPRRTSSRLIRSGRVAAAS